MCPKGHTRVEISAYVHPWLHLSLTPNLGDKPVRPRMAHDSIDCLNASDHVNLGNCGCNFFEVIRRFELLAQVGHPSERQHSRCNGLRGGEIHLLAEIHLSLPIAHYTVVPVREGYADQCE